jgi:hypothetical protein
MNFVETVTNMDEYFLEFMLWSRSHKSQQNFGRALAATGAGTLYASAPSLYSTWIDFKKWIKLKHCITLFFSHSYYTEWH